MKKRTFLIPLLGAALGASFAQSASANDQTMNIIDDPAAMLPDAVTRTIELPEQAGAGEASNNSKAGIDQANSARENRRGPGDLPDLPGDEAITSELSAMAATPELPETPVVDVPVTDTPAMPERPDTPAAMPDLPSMPDRPDTPVVDVPVIDPPPIPDTPAAMPDLPSMPDRPDTPVVDVPVIDPPPIPDTPAAMPDLPSMPDRPDTPVVDVPVVDAPPTPDIPGRPM